MNNFELEEKELEKIKKVIINERLYLNDRLEKIPWEYKGRYAEVKWGDEDLVQHLTAMTMDRLRKIKSLENNPYFGSFSFTQKGLKERTFRLGKTNVSEDSDVLVLDWRSPICTLYYDQSLGKVSYVVSNGVIEGELTNKKQILIQDGKLVSVRDVDLVSDDELLQPYLNINADNRMKTIIASIQAEQNAIIREPFSKNLIVQGVAGSGKTSVALHRIAYLLYNNSEISADKFVIIGPNKYFLNYISSILPDLDTQNASEYTFEELGNDIIAEKGYKCESSTDELSRFLASGGKNAKIKQFKGSLEYKNCLYKFLQDYFISVLKYGVKFENIDLISREELQKGITIKYNYSKGINDFIKMMTQKIKSQFEDKYYELVEPLKQEMLKYPLLSKERNDVISRMDKLKSILQKGCNKELKAIVKPLFIRPLNIYKLFLNNIEKYIDLPLEELKSFKEETLKMLKKKIIPYEDIAAVCFLSTLYYGNGYYDKYKHIVIDEAQDYSLFQFDLLKILFNKGSFSIFGDLAQSIYSYRSISSWEEIQKLIFNDNCERLDMLKSYRTTQEITIAANYVLNQLNLAEANPVIRTGTNIDIFQGRTSNDIALCYLNKIKSFAEKGYKSIGIICKNEVEMQNVKKILDKINVSYNYVTSSDVEYNGGISLLTSYLAKGLEFDAVIINNASNKNYDPFSSVDMHLLYVAMTRALHELNIIYTDDLCEVLNQMNNVRIEKPNKLIRKL